MTSGRIRRSPPAVRRAAAMLGIATHAILVSCGGSSAARPDVELAPIAAVPGPLDVPAEVRRLADSLADMAAPPVDAKSVYGRMWTFENPPLRRWRTEFGFDPSTGWLDRTRRAALRLGEFCSAGFVSADGLIATSYDCVGVCLERGAGSGSTGSHPGFLASDRPNEARCGALHVDQLVSAVDVSERLLGSRSTRDLRGVERREALEMLSRELEDACGQTAGRVCRVAELYEGRRYVLYQYDRFPDVRLVYAPAEAQARPEDGSPSLDWPRNELRIALLRAYTSDGEPLSSPHYFIPGRAGPEAGETVLAVGHPGPTSRRITLSQFMFERSVRHPLLLELFRDRLAILDPVAGFDLPPGLANARAGLATNARLFAAELEALMSPQIAAYKVLSDHHLRQHLHTSHEWQAEYAGAWDEMAAVQVEKTKLFPDLILSDPASLTAAPHVQVAAGFVARADQMSLPEEERSPPFRGTAGDLVAERLVAPGTLDVDLGAALLAGRLELARKWLDLDHPLRQVLAEHGSPEGAARALVEGSRLNEEEFRRRLLSLPADSLAAIDDPLLQLGRQLVRRRARARDHWTAVTAREAKLASRISMARWAVFGDSIAPDGSRTLRVSEGRVDSPLSDTGFLSTNDASGGTGGSPVVGIDGRIVGVLVDGNAAAAAGEFVYGAPGARTISVRFEALVDALADHPEAVTLLGELRLLDP